MVAMDGELKGLLQQARRAAQKRSQRPSTGHVLLVMLQNGSAPGRVLASRGMREGDLLSALKVVDDEPSSALEVAVERSQKLAAALGDSHARAMHLLFGITRDARTVGHRCLEQTGTGAARVHEEIGTLLGLGDSGSAPPRSGQGVLAREAAGRSGSTRKGEEGPAAKTGHAAASSGGWTVAEGFRARRQLTLPRPTGSSRTARSDAAPTVPRARAGDPAEADGKPDVDSEGSAQQASGQTPPPAPAGPAEKARSNRPRNRRSRRSARVGDVLGDPSPPGPFELDRERYPLLSTLGRNLTDAASRGLVDPVIGREPEVEQLLDVLARRRANNPVLVGPPGVGKTAVVEALARRLVDGGEGVRGLEGRLLVEISAGSLISGTGVRGALAERIKQLRDEVARSSGRIVLFIDEIHAIVGPSEGADELANELKSSLARGELPCVGATTEAEYRKYFDRDAALARRFSPIHVEEPDAADAVLILQGIASRYEMHHGVSYTSDAIEAAVDLSVRFLSERHLPDKAIGVLDLAAARVRRRGGESVDRAAVASVIAEQARVPLDRLLMRDADRLLEIEGRLAERVVGHDAAIARIADALRKGAAGFRGERPLGSFLLLGPTGVGKTETARAISDVLFPGGGMTRLDMSEFSEAHAVARLLGAPPGYVGHEAGGQLTEAVRRRPYQLLLLDEIEKAHPDVLLALLPLLEDGRLTDGRGRTVDFRNTVIFMTSNLGAVTSPPPRIGFGASSEGDGYRAQRMGERALEAARRALPPELWNRIDEPLFFGPLQMQEVAEIARRMLASIGATLQRDKNVGLEFDRSGIDALIEAGGYEAELGARPMRRIIGRLVEAPIAEAILRHDVHAGDALRVEGAGATVRVVPVRGADAAE